MINTHYKPRNWLRVIQKIIVPKIYIVSELKSFYLTNESIDYLFK